MSAQVYTGRACIGWAFETAEEAASVIARDAGAKEWATRPLWDGSMGARGRLVLVLSPRGEELGSYIERPADGAALGCSDE